MRKIGTTGFKLGKHMFYQFFRKNRNNVALAVVFRLNTVAASAISVRRP